MRVCEGERGPSLASGLTPPWTSSSAAQSFGHRVPDTQLSSGQGMSEANEKVHGTTGSRVWSAL